MGVALKGRLGAAAAFAAIALAAAACSSVDRPEARSASPAASATQAPTATSPPAGIERMRVGRGVRSALIVRPAGVTGPQPWVLFIHGWGLAAGDYRAWVRHLARRGNTVVLPRYQLDQDSDPGRSLRDVIAGVRAALRVAPVAPGSLVAAGHSAGAALATDYAAVSGRLALPRPVAVYAVYPGRAILGHPAGIPPADASRIAPDTELVALAGAADSVVGQAPAQQLLAAATRVRTSRYILVRDAEAADHYAPTRRTDDARRVFWRRLDRLIDRARAER